MVNVCSRRFLLIRTGKLGTAHVAGNRNGRPSEDRRRNKAPTNGATAPQGAGHRRGASSRRPTQRPTQTRDVTMGWVSSLPRVSDEQATHTETHTDTRDVTMGWVGSLPRSRGEGVGLKAGRGGRCGSRRAPKHEM